MGDFLQQDKAAFFRALTDSFPTGKVKLFVIGGAWESGMEVKITALPGGLEVCCAGGGTRLYLFLPHKIKNFRKEKKSFYLTLVYFDYEDMKVSLQFLNTL